MIIYYAVFGNCRGENFQKSGSFDLELLERYFKGDEEANEALPFDVSYALSSCGTEDLLSTVNEGKMWTGIGEESAIALSTQGIANLMLNAKAKYAEGF